MFVTPLAILLRGNSNLHSECIMGGGPSGGLGHEGGALTRGSPESSLTLPSWREDALGSLQARKTPWPWTSVSRMVRNKCLYYFYFIFISLLYQPELRHLLLVTPFLVIIFSLTHPDLYIYSVNTTAWMSNSLVSYQIQKGMVISAPCLLYLRILLLQLHRAKALGIIPDFSLFS